MTNTKAEEKKRKIKRKKIKKLSPDNLVFRMLVSDMVISLSKDLMTRSRKKIIEEIDCYLMEMKFLNKPSIIKEFQRIHKTGTKVANT